MSEINEGINSLPMVWKAIAIVGFPIIVALVLLLAFLGLLPDKHTERYESVFRAHNALTTTTYENNALLKQNQNIMLDNGRISFALCINLSRDGAARERCLKAERGEHP